MAVTRILRAGAIAGAALLLSSCSSGLLRQPLRMTVDDSDHRVVARAPDDPTDRKRVTASYFAYLPKKLPMKPGQHAFFSMRSRGEPHTVTLGTMVDAAGKAIDALGPDATLAQIEALPEMQALPSVLPLQLPAQGDPQVNGSAAEPCYLVTGAPPTAPAGGAPRCEERSRPSFNGRQAFFNSGWLGRDASFTIELADDTKPGTYTIMCLIHRSQMRGELEVLGSGRSLPKVGDYDKQGARAVTRIANQLTEPASNAAFVASAGEAVAGAGTPGVPGVLTTFGKKTYKVSPGGAVSWSVFGMHTITFDAPDGDKDLFVKRDGQVALNLDVWRPAGGTGGAGAGVPPPAQAFAAGGEPVVVDGGTYDGNGPHHSGVLRSFGFPPVTYTVTFPKAGTYRYRCLIHPVMSGKVEVG